MITLSILEAFVRNWWVLLTRGILAVLFAVLAFTLPYLTLVKLVLLYCGTYVFVYGLMMLVLQRVVAAGGAVCVSIGRFAPAVWAISRKSNQTVIANIPVVYDHS